jgi:hypothetical protein
VLLFLGWLAKKLRDELLALADKFKLPGLSPFRPPKKLVVAGLLYYFASFVSFVSAAGEDTFAPYSFVYFGAGGFKLSPVNAPIAGNADDALNRLAVGLLSAGLVLSDSSAFLLYPRMFVCADLVLLKIGLV